MSEWISVEDRLPEGNKKVIAFYLNQSNKARRIMAQYTIKNTELSNMDDGANDEYNEDEDAYYIKEGWYECIENWPDWNSIVAEDGEITHWQPLPEPPKD